MIPLETLRELYEFNYWARDRQFQTCATFPSEQFLRPMGNSFSSVRDTLAHLLVVEWIWLERWEGRSPAREDTKAFAAEKFPTLESLQAAWGPVEKGVRDFLRACSEERLSQPLSYTNFQGEVWTYPLWRILYHVVNHQTYHRGQIATLLRQLGATPLQTDYLVALDMHFHK
ncbi:MAG: DinB family protein [Terriglobia bacterium]